MTNLDKKANRAYPSIPGVSGSLESHTQVLQAVKQAIEIHERRTSNYLDSFISVRELINIGLLETKGPQVVSALGGDTGQAVDHGSLGGLLDDDHPQYLRRSELEGEVQALDIAASQITGRLPFANIAQITGQAVLGVAASGAGDLAAITAGTNDRLLRQTGDALNFGQLTSGMFPDDVVPDGALSSNVALYDGNVNQFSVGTFLDARVAESNVTQHQAALSIAGSQLTGTVPDARLSSNVALLDQTNVFTRQGSRLTAAVLIQHDFPDIAFFEEDAAADEGGWDILANNGRLTFRTFTDAGGGGSDWLTVDRTNSGIDLITFPSSPIAWGGGSAIASSDDVALLNTTPEFTAGVLISGSGSDLAFSNGVSSFFDDGSVHIYRSETDGSGLSPFNIFGNLVLEARGDSGRRIAFVTNAVERGTIGDSGLAWGGGSPIASSDDVSSTSSGSFSGTFADCTGDPTRTIHWSRTGNSVTLYVTADRVAPGDGSGNFRITGLPAALRPTNEKSDVCGRLDNGDSTNDYLSQVRIGTGGTLTFELFQDGVSGIDTNITWQVTGDNLGLKQGWSITYDLD